MSFNSVISRVPQRWIVCALCSLAIVIINLKNVCYFSIEEIVNSATEKKRMPSGGCPFLFSGTTWEKRELPLHLPEFYWSPKVMVIANSAFHIGKMLAAVPAGVLSDLGYSRHVLGGGMLLNAIGILLLLVIVTSDVIVYVIQNFFDGVGEALVYTSIVTLISRWALPSERNFYTALVVAGAFCGEDLGNLFFKVFYLEFRSWRVGHFMTGALGLLWVAFGFIFIYHSPDQSPFVHQQEYLNSSSINQRRTLTLRLLRLQGIPWRKILPSLPFLSLILAFCSVEWVAFLNVWQSFERYQKFILRLPETFSDDSTTMMITAIPPMLMGGLFADWITKHNLMSKTNVKKTFTFISVVFSSILQVTSTWVGCNIIMFWVLCITSVYTLGLAQPVIYSAPIDLSARRAGMLMGFMLVPRTVCSVFEEHVYRFVVTDIYNLNQWRYKFLLSSTLSLVLMIPFLFFGSGEAQYWQSPLRRAVPLSDDHSAIELDRLPTSKTPPPTIPS